jgi:hypothetical protein
MAKSTILAGACIEPETKSRSQNNPNINTLRKPLKLTATLKRRALKKKKEEAVLDSGAGADA